MAVEADQSIRAWSFAYFRFWLVQDRGRRNPMARGSSGRRLYALDMRALGARIGRGATILHEHRCVTDTC